MIPRWQSFLLTMLFTFFVYPLGQAGAERYDELQGKVERLMEENRGLMERLKKVERELSALKAKQPGNPVEEDIPGDDSLGEAVRERVTLSGLLEFGGVYRNTSYGHKVEEEESDLAMTTVELDFSAQIMDWVNVTGVLLYEDPTFTPEENSLDVDSASIVLGHDKGPFTLTLGKVYVPFGALFTTFPDAPLIDSPLTLLLGEANEKAAILEYSTGGLFISTYAFNGDVEERGEAGNRIDGYGFDINFQYGFDFSQLNFYKRGEKFKHKQESCIDFVVGASYISNLADSDYVSDMIGDVVDNYVGGVDLYYHLEHRRLFLDIEFMGATEKFSESVLPSGNSGARPYVWNLEAGFTYNWWKDLQVAFKWAGSHDTEALAMPERRYGINFNQLLFEGVTFSIGYIHDEYHDNDIEGRDARELAYGQMAVAF